MGSKTPPPYEAVGSFFGLPFLSRALFEYRFREGNRKRAAPYPNLVVFLGIDICRDFVVLPADIPLERGETRLLCIRTILTEVDEKVGAVRDGKSVAETDKIFSPHLEKHRVPFRAVPEKPMKNARAECVGGHRFVRCGPCGVSRIKRGYNLHFFLHLYKNILEGLVHLLRPP